MRFLIASTIEAATRRHAPISNFPTIAFWRKIQPMIAARARTARTDGPAYRLVLIVLVAACGGQPALAQTAASGGQPVIRPAAGGDLSLIHI